MDYRQFRDGYVYRPYHVWDRWTVVFLIGLLGAGSWAVLGGAVWVILKVCQ